MSWKIFRWLAFLLEPSLVLAQVTMASGTGPVATFGGQTHLVPVTFHNAGGAAAEVELRIQLYQASAATVVPWGEGKNWKKLQVLPGQTVLEEAELSFPAVRAETKFLVQWLERTNRVLGKSEVLVYPTNLLEELKLLVDDGGRNLGVLDPENQLKPALRHAAIKFVDLAETELDAFAGKLAMVGPCAPDDPEWSGLTERITRLAQKGTPVVWMQPLQKKPGKIWPSFYTVLQNRAAVVVVQPAMVAGLADNPQSQLNLIYFSKLALQPPPLALPELSPHP